MGKLITIVAVVVVATFLLPAVALAQAPDACWFYGDVVIDGVAAPDGTVVSAWIEGNMTDSTTTSGGEYALTVGELGRSYPGATVTFKVDGQDTGVTRTWTAGEPFETDLTVGEGQITPGVEIIVDPVWSDGNSTLEGGVLTLYLGPKPADGATGATGATGPAGEDGEDAAGGIALPIVALVIAIIAAGVALMGMRRRV